MKQINIQYSLDNKQQLKYLIVSVLSIINSQKDLSKFVFNFILINDKELIVNLEEFLRVNDINYEIKTIDEIASNQKILDKPVVWWLWGISKFKGNHNYSLVLDNDTIIGKDLFELANINVFCDESKTMAGVRYGNWGKEFYKNKRMIKKAHKTKEKIDDSLENFFNSGVVLVNKERFIKKNSDISLNKTYDKYYANAKRSLFFTEWVRRNDEMFLISYYHDQLIANLNKDNNFSIHSTPPFWYSNINEFVIHLFWPKKYLAYNIIFSSNDNLNENVEEFKNHYYKIWKNCKLNGIRIQSTIEEVDSSYEKILDILLKSNKIWLEYKEKTL